MSASKVALLVQLATTLPMVGLIWFIQVVAYPQFARVGAEQFAAYHEAHARLITFIVAPLMLLELMAALSWVVYPPDCLPRAWVLIGAGLALGVWAATMLLSVPQHNVLSSGFDAAAWSRLVTTNWVRTALWSVRGVLLLTALVRALASTEVP